MEAIKVQDVAVNDLPWQIDYHANRCTMCGSCIASCALNAKILSDRREVVVIDNNPEVIRWKQ